MTNPRGSAANQAAVSAALSGAVDLSALKARAEATRNQPAGPPGQAPPGGGTAAGGPAAGGGAAFDITEATFQSEVAERSLRQLVVAVVWTSRSPQTAQYADMLAGLAEASGGKWVLAKVELDAEPQIAQALAQVVRAQTVPVVVMFAGGQPVGGFDGPVSEAEFGQYLNQVVQELRDKVPFLQDMEPAEQPEDPRFTEAEKALEDGDYAAAEAAYQRILDAEPANEDAKAALAQVKFAQRTEKADASTVARADADPDDLDAQFAAADFEVAQDKAEEAFARLIAAVRRTAGDDRNRVRTQLVGLFELFDPADERVAKARRDLASALY